MTSLIGELELHRAYYHCRGCRQGQVPWDASLAVDRRDLTPAAAEVTTLAGTLSSFAQASERTLRKLAGLRMSESTVERTTEDAGARLGALRRAKQCFGAQRLWPWQLDARGRRCAYVSLDATGVPRQGSGGALTDGGNGLEAFMHRNFPLAQCILDFYHASQHVANLARALHPADDEAFERQTQAWCHQLKHEGGAALLTAWEQLDVSARNADMREAYRQETGYLRNNAHRADYPTYLANGWQIGSGPVEAACKNVIGQRLKGSGMRWGDPGADAVCHLRALYCSEPDQWEAFWLAHPN